MERITGVPSSKRNVSLSTADIDLTSLSTPHSFCYTKEKVVVVVSHECFHGTLSTRRASSSSDRDFISVFQGDFSYLRVHVWLRGFVLRFTRFSFQVCLIKYPDTHVCSMYGSCSYMHPSKTKTKTSLYTTGPTRV